MSTSGSRVQTLRLIAGRPALDLVNTVSWRGDPNRREDHLTGDAACLVWCRRTAVLSASESQLLKGRDIRSPMTALRDAISICLDDPDHAAGAIQPPIDDALRHGRLTQQPAGYTWQVNGLDAKTPSRRLALDLLDLLQGPPGPIRFCGDEACRWVYVDTSRGQRRRWCSSDDCGNRNRVRRHAALARG